MPLHPGLIKNLCQGDIRSLSRCISIVENGGTEASVLMRLLPSAHAPVTGITGPPGAGKSTLINMLVKHLSAGGKKVAVLAIDPSSPFGTGALLGDRIRMQEHFNDPKVYIRSLSARGTLGGVSSRTPEVLKVMHAAGFDHILVETVGVGQSEMEVRKVADTVVLVLVPESGDSIQTMKSGLIEVADILVVNKSDRPGADSFLKDLHHRVKDLKRDGWIPPVIRAVALQGEGGNELTQAIMKHLKWKKKLG